MSTSHPIPIEAVPRRVRGTAGGRTVFDTVHPLFVWERPHYPTYYLPAVDVDMDVLIERGSGEHHDGRGTASRYDLEVGAEVREDAAYAYPEPEAEPLADHVAFRWEAMDHWFEEDEEVFAHARDPYTRVDILRSSREVRIEIDGREMASTTAGSFLFETGHPVRYYMPKTDVRFDLLSESDTRTQCPYKGTARYWHATVDGAQCPDIVWGYDYPLPESQKLAGLVCFYDEKVDVFVDGELQERPRTKFA